MKGGIFMSERAPQEFEYDVDESGFVELNEAEAVRLDIYNDMNTGEVPSHVQSAMASNEKDKYDLEKAQAQNEPLPKADNAPLQANAQDADIEAEQALSDAPNGNEAGSFFSKAVNTVSYPFQKARQYFVTKRLEKEQKKLNEQKLALAILKAEIEARETYMESIIKAEQEREMRKQAFILQLEQNAEKLGKNVQKGLQKGLGMAGQVYHAVRDKTTEWANNYAEQRQARQEEKVVVDDGLEVENETLDTPEVSEQVPEKVSNVVPMHEQKTESEVDYYGEDLQEQIIIETIAERLRDKHLERRAFNQTMSVVHRKEVGNQPLTLAADDTGLSGKLAYEETKDFLEPGRFNNTYKEVHNDAYYQYALDVYSDQVFEESEGDELQADFSESAKDLYAGLKAEHGGATGYQSFDRQLLNAFEKPFPSKRFYNYVGTNPQFEFEQEQQVEMYADPNIEQEVDDYDVVFDNEFYDNVVDIEKRAEMAEHEPVVEQTVVGNKEAMNERAFEQLEDQVGTKEAEELVEDNESDIREIMGNLFLEDERYIENQSRGQQKTLDKGMDLDGPG